MDYLTQFVAGLLGPRFADFAFSLTIGIAVMLALFSAGLIALAVVDPLRRRIRAVSESKGDVADPLVALALQQSADEIAHDYKRRAQVVQLVLLITLPLAVFALASKFGNLQPSIVFLAAAVSAGVGFLVPPVIADIAEAKRVRALAVGFPEALDLLVACTEAGMGLNAAFLRVDDQMVFSHPAIAHQFNLVNYEIRGGVDRFEALRNLASRTGIDSVRSLCSILSQSMRYGTSISETLRVFAEDLRDRRMQAAEEAAAKIGTKMIFPLVLCMFPAFFIIAVGPAVIGAIRALSE